MSAKAILVLFAQALLVQGIYSQCAGIGGPAYAAEDFNIAGNGLAYGAGLGAYGPAPYGPAGYAGGYNVAPTSGGGFAVTSSSPIAPTGITVISENAIEGPISVVGELPFLSAVAVEGSLPSAGSGGINYGCGSGAVGIVSENVAPAGPAAAYPAGYGIGPAGLSAGLPYGAGLSGLGFGARGLGLGGCGAVY